MFKKSRNHFEIRFDNEVIPKLKDLKKILHGEIQESIRINDIRRYRYSVDVCNRVVELENSLYRLALELRGIDEN